MPLGPCLYWAGCVAISLAATLGWVLVVIAISERDRLGRVRRRRFG